MTELTHVSVGGLKVATASCAELVRSMIEDIRAHRDDPTSSPPRLVFDSNGQAISLAARDPAYREAMDAADLIHADGGFVVSISGLVAGETIKERSATTDLIHDFALAAAREGLSFYLLGGTEGVNALCAERLAKYYPGLRIAGRRHGYFREAEEEAVIADIARAGPDVLWVGLGKPREQIFAVRHRDRLEAGWVITCGGCFNFVTGHYSRAPQWMQRFNLEWLYRALTDRKLFRRYAVTSPHAIWLALTRIDRGRYASASSEGR